MKGWSRAARLATLAGAVGGRGRVRSPREPNLRRPRSRGPASCAASSQRVAGRLARRAPHRRHRGVAPVTVAHRSDERCSRPRSRSRTWDLGAETPSAAPSSTPMATTATRSRLSRTGRRSRRLDGGARRRAGQQLRAAAVCAARAYLAGSARPRGGAPAAPSAGGGACASPTRVRRAMQRFARRRADRGRRAAAAASSSGAAVHSGANVFPSDEIESGSCRRHRRGRGRSGRALAPRSQVANDCGDESTAVRSVRHGSPGRRARAVGEAHDVETPRDSLGSLPRTTPARDRGRRQVGREAIAAGRGRDRASVASRAARDQPFMARRRPARGRATRRRASRLAHHEALPGMTSTRTRRAASA